MPPVETPVYVFGTSGYRNDTDEGFNEAVVRQITRSISDYLIGEMEQAGEAWPILIGGDTREKSKRFIPLIAKMFEEAGLDVWQVKGDVPTPVLAYAAKYFTPPGASKMVKTAGAVLMTASHNPWAYGGYNFLTADAAVVPSSVSHRFVELQKNPQNKTLDRKRFGLETPASIQTFDPYPAYKEHLEKQIKLDFTAIKNVGLQIFYDPLYATGRNYFPRLLKENGIDIQTIHNTEERPKDYTGMPEPSAKNLGELAGLMSQATSKRGLKIGFANDGDADRFGVLNEAGTYLAPNDVLALTLYHMIKNRKAIAGVVVRSQATSHLLDELAKQAGLGVVQTPVGYKYIAEEFIEREEKNEPPVILGGESSGGLSIGGHIPEKDGLIANLLIAELVATENKPLSEILASVHASVPRKFAFQELAIKTPEGKALQNHYQKLMETGGELAGLTADPTTSKTQAEALEKKFGTRDGVKVYFNDGSWLLVRLSGTEPLARIYMETTGDTDAVAATKLAEVLAAVEKNLADTFAVSAADITRKA